MNNKEKLEYISELLKATENVSTWIYNSDWDLIDTNNSWENELKNIFYLGKNADTAQSYFDTEHRAVYLNDDFGLSWCAYNDISSKLIYVLGPIMTTSISKDILRTQMDLKDMRVSSQIKFLNLSKTIPVVPRSFFNHLNAIFFYVLFQERQSADEFFIPDSNTNTSINVADESAPQQYHGSYSFEQAILANVEEGNINYDLTPPKETPQYYDTGTLAPGNPIRQRKDESIVYITLVTRAAIRGGLNPEIAYNLSDHYIQRIEASNEITDINSIGGEMYDTFIRQVHNTKNSETYSRVVSDCLAILRANITNEINIKDIAESLGYAPYYLTRLIQKETGKSYREHVAIAKIDYAKSRLKDLSLSMTEISSELHYSTPSYFSAQFKEIVGMTPKEYRNSVYDTLKLPKKSVRIP